jgi:hypothetical protein
MLINEITEGTRCWKGYKKKGMKTMFGKRVPNCVKNESVNPDKMTGDQMLNWLNSLHKWDGGIRNPEYKNDVRKNTWVLINKFPLAKLQNPTGYVPDEEDTDDPYNRVIDPDEDYAMQTDLGQPIVVHSDKTTVLDGNHRVHKAREMGKTHLPAYYPIIDENFADGKKKGKSRPGRVKRAGASCKGSVSSLRAKAKKYSGERGKMYHWCANMKGGKKK